MRTKSSLSDPRGDARRRASNRCKMPSHEESFRIQSANELLFRFFAHLDIDICVRILSKTLTFFPNASRAAEPRRCRLLHKLSSLVSRSSRISFFYARAPHHRGSILMSSPNRSRPRHLYKLSPHRPYLHYYPHPPLCLPDSAVPSRWGAVLQLPPDLGQHCLTSWTS